MSVKLHVNSLSRNHRNHCVVCLCQCLKESYVKALGVGIGFSLQRLDFHTHTDTIPGQVITDTRLYLDGHCLDDWQLQETMLDDSHCVAVAVKQV